MSARTFQWFIIPVEGPAALHTFTSDDGTTLKELQQIVGGLIECVSMNHEIDMWVNEEGRIIGLEPNIKATMLLVSQGWEGGMILGPAVITGYDGDGNTISVPQDMLDFVLGDAK